MKGPRWPKADSRNHFIDRVTQATTKPAVYPDTRRPPSPTGAATEKVLAHNRTKNVLTARFAKPDTPKRWGVLYERHRGAVFGFVSWRRKSEHPGHRRGRIYRQPHSRCP
jgi:hypothetical protein